jgi:CBS domain-containing protein
MQDMIVRDLMTPEPVALDVDDTVGAAAEVMAENDIGAVIVEAEGTIQGIVTDRDVTVRCVGRGQDPFATPLGSICSDHLATLSPNDPVNRAVELMSELAVRRLPVVDNGHAVGIISIGDLAINLDDESVLSDISAAPPND